MNMHMLQKEMIFYGLVLRVRFQALGFQAIKDEGTHNSLMDLYVHVGNHINIQTYDRAELMDHVHRDPFMICSEQCTQPP